MTCEFSSSITCNEGFLGPSLTDACPGSAFFIFMNFINVWTRANEKISGVCKRINPVEIPDDVYDFVVVGGGAAGSVIAARLSEIYDWKVLLLEAGPDEPVGAEIPGFASQFLKTRIIWNYTTTNESYACLSTNGSCPWPSGKNLGGNTVHNGMLYIRGNPTDYNKWAEAGNEGWTWDEVEPFFMKSEDNSEIDRVGREHHGTGGPLSVGKYLYVAPFGYSILAAAQEAGFGISEDLNGDKLTGFSIIQGTIKNGVRSSSARAFLWPIRNRKNLHVSLNSTVTRVIIENDRSVGVEYSKNGELRIVYATREVILSAGVVESPHILLLSGIGPQDHLESMNVEVVKDSPGVGENLHDHPGTFITYTINDADAYDNNWLVAKEYLKFQTGALSGIGSNSVIGQLPSNATKIDFPDIQIYMGSYFENCAPGEVGALKSSGKRPVYVLSAYLHPKSRGRITLASKNPFELPIIWCNYLGESEDVDRVVDGVRMTLELMDTDALRPYNFTLSDPLLEACSGYEFSSDEYWACAARQFNYALYHQAGTCKMGPASDPMAVVDPRLRVHGIRGLRVADASIMPQVPSGNTAASVMMIGERAADFIKEDWDRKFQHKICSCGMWNKIERNQQSSKNKVPPCNTAASAMMIGERGADFIQKDWTHEFANYPSTCHASE